MNYMVLGIMLMALLAIGSTYEVSNALPTGSMEPYIHGGDTLYILRPWVMGDLKVGDVVSFKPNGNTSAIQMMHRIVEVRSDGTILTKGDANPTVDEGSYFPRFGWCEPVRKEWVTGKLFYISR